MKGAATAAAIHLFNGADLFFLDCHAIREGAYKLARTFININLCIVKTAKALVYLSYSSI
jgi:hypothetical protein